jgi:hypothetical protein
MITNTIFENNTRYAVHENGTSGDAAPVNCLFQGNYSDDGSTPGDYWDEGAFGYTGANAINMYVAGAQNNVQGDPLFVSGPTGAWTAAPVYDAVTNRTTLINSGGGFAVNALRGRLINADTTQRFQALVASNTATQVVVVGDVSFAASGDTYCMLDYHLQNGSYALDRGTTTGAPVTDFEGDARPGTDAKVDIGVDEAPDAYAPPPDTTAPVSRAYGLAPVVNTAIFDVPYAASDSETGVQHVRFYYSKDGGPWTQYGGDFTSSPVIFTSVGDGHYGFYTRATDNTGNVEPAKTVADATTLLVSSFTGSRVYVAGDATGSQTGQSWTNALHTISAGLSIAELFAVPEVWVKAGTYPETVTLRSGVSLYGGFAGTETLLSQRNWTTNVTTINATTVSPRFHVVTMDGVTNARLDGFWVTGGNANGPDANNNYGGGIYCPSADDTNVIVNCIVTGNTAGNYGGGVYMDGGFSVDHELHRERK